MADINRFIEPHTKAYKTALEEIKRGHKETHWIWYIFPQLVGLGYSSTANYYGIEDLNEATDYLNHPILGKDLIEITEELYKQTNHIDDIFPYPDNLKVKSCMTLFELVDESPDIFANVLEKFYDGARDDRTLELLDLEQNKSIR